VFFSAGSISTAEGSALVKLGNTSVVCGIKPVIGSLFRNKCLLGQQLFSIAVNTCHCSLCCAVYNSNKLPYCYRLVDCACNTLDLELSA